MDSDDDDFVALGTPLEPLAEDDELPTKKPIHEQTVHDEKGRQRFHGAFTGGFAAGYFNSVGSKEGWAPSSFLSSRSQKAEKIRQNPEDFMDNEDLGAFGIAPRKVQILDHFHDTDKDSSSRKRNLLISSDGPIPGESPLRELVKPISASVGVKILQQMGWRPGQGIGPKEKRKQKPMIRVYGCELPSSQHDSEDDDDPYAAQYMFAPKDQEMLPYKPKDNLFGIGYSGLSKDPVLSTHVNLFEPTHTSAVLDKKKKLIIAGEAFGVGAFEAEDADIYAKDDMTQYDFALEESCKNQESSCKPSRNKTLGYVKKVLEGFHLSSKAVSKKPNYPPPSLPSTFKPIHQPSKTLQPVITNPVQETKRFLDRHQMSSQDRTALLEGQSTACQKGAVSSVFDLISPEDKLKLQRIQKSKEEMRLRLSQSPLQGGQQMSSFKPFQNDPEKQARYEKYQTLVKMGKTDCLDSVHLYSMTEWEKQREKEEFQRAIMLYQPLSTSLSSRFVSSSQLDNDRDVEIRVDQDGDKTDQKKAAELKMYGKLTRERFEWHPAQLLCKRFNVPNPYPDCRMVGLPKVKRDKYSIFNFLTVPSDVEPSKKAEISDHSTLAISTEHIKKEIEGVEVNQEIKVENEEASITLNNDSPTIQEDTENKTSKPPMDLFKAIFQNTSSEDSNSSDEETSQHQPPTESNMQIPQQSEENVQLSEHKPENFPPAFGVFANIDLDALNNEQELPSENINVFNKSDPNMLSGGNNSTPSLSALTKDQNVEDFYGPKLPPSTSDDCIYIGEKQRDEKESRSHRKHKKHKHHKHKEDKSKSKKDKHRSKHKHKKPSSLLKERRSSCEESSDSDANTDVKILERLQQLKRRTYDI